MEERLANRALSRRSFIKAAAVTAGIAALSGSAGTLTALAETAEVGSAEDVKRIRTVCRACGKMECGVWVTVKDGKAIRVEGDQSSFTSRGNCCTKSQSSIQACYHPDRLRYPMKRTNPKGEDPGWVRISWDEAMALSAEKFTEIQNKYGGPSLLTMNGTSRMWAMGGYAPLKIILGTPNGHLASAICKGPRFFTTAVTDMYGSNWMTSAEEPRVYVEWGGNIEYSNYDDSCRNVVNASQNADTFIIIDPRMTGIGKEADYWLNVRPGTDQAIALAWAKIIMDHGLMDELYMKRWSNGAFLVVDDMEPTGGWMLDNTGVIDMKTKLLKESDLVEGGSYQKFMVHDAVRAAAGKTGNDALGYLDVETTQWEGDSITTDAAMQNGKWVKEGTPWEGWLPEPTTFAQIDPDLYGEYEVTLKDGTTVKCKTVWQKYAEMLADKTPEWAAEITGVDAEKIEKACLAWATNLDPESGYNNGGIHISLAMDQNGNNFQTIRSIMMLSHMTGNLDGPAGNRGPTHAFFRDGIWLPWWAFDYPGDPDDPMSAPGPVYEADQTTFMKNAAMVGGDKFPLTRWYNQWCEPHSLWQAVLTGDPYPIVGGANDSGSFMNQNNSGEAWEAMNKLDFWMEVNLWHHPTAECADVLLPCYHWLEMRFPRISQGPHCGLAMNCQCVEAPGDCKNDPEIMEELFRAMGMPWNFDESNPYPTWDETLEHMYASAKMPFESYKAFEEDFQKNGWSNAKKIYPKIMGTYRRYETGYTHVTSGVGDAQPVWGLEVPGCDPGHRFGYKTPTSRYELWPTVVETYCMDNDQSPVGYDWMVPDYIEPCDSPVSNPEKAAEYPFIATTGRRIPVYFHSEHRQLPWCREQWPVPKMEINPLDAEELGIEQGDWCWIRTPYGEIREVADLYHGIGRGVVNLEHAWWFPELSAPNHGEHLCNCNRLLDPEHRDPFTASSCMRGFLVQIEKATPENSPFGNPVPCDDDGTEIIHDPSDPRLKEWLPDFSLNGSDY